MVLGYKRGSGVTKDDIIEVGVWFPLIIIPSCRYSYPITQFKKKNPESCEYDLDQSCP
jgi:hypothetical protein